jgi:hypothetical protein
VVRQRYPVPAEEQWVPLGRPARVAGHDIRCGLLYVGRHLRSATGDVEPALIDPHLPVAPSAGASAGTDTGPPAYHLISPGARAAYLGWLAGGRRGEVPTSLVLLFVFGLERRVLSDDPAARPEFTAITAEVRRLRARYGDADSAFRATLDRLLDLLRLLTAPRIASGGPAGRAAAASASFDEDPRTSMSLRVTLAGFAATATPVPADWAGRWVRHHPSLTPRAAQTRCSDEFDRLFALRYLDRYGAGLVPTDEVRGIRLRYQPASPGLTTTLVCREDLPDVLTEPLSTRLLGGLADGVAAALDPYNRWLARFPDGRDSLAAAALLPAELLDPDRGRLGALRVWAEAHLDGRPRAVIDTAEFQAFWSTAARHRMTREESTALIEVLALLGVGVEPDVRFGAPALTRGPAVLFRVDPALSAAPGPGFGAAAAIVRCAGAVASAVGPVDPEGAVGAGVLATVPQLAIRLRLAPQDASRLTARLCWSLARGESVDSLARSTAPLGAVEREVAGRYVISVAAAVDPTIGPAAVGVLTRLYRILGLHQNLLFSRVHASAVAGSTTGWSIASAESAPPDPLDEPVLVRRSDPVDGGHPLPWAVTPTAATSGGVRLDQSTIERKLAESTEVATLLDALFDDAPPATDSTPDDVATQITGLDLAHSHVLQALADRRTWTREEFAALARAHGVLPDGALDLLNDVAIETVGAPVIEGGTVLAVYDDILQELLG